MLGEPGSSYLWTRIWGCPLYGCLTINVCKMMLFGSPVCFWTVICPCLNCPCYGSHDIWSFRVHHFYYLLNRLIGASPFLYPLHNFSVDTAVSEGKVENDSKGLLKGSPSLLGHHQVFGLILPLLFSSLLRHKDSFPPNTWDLWMTRYEQWCQYRTWRYRLFPHRASWLETILWGEKTHFKNIHFFLTPSSRYLLSLPHHMWVILWPLPVIIS